MPSRRSGQENNTESMEGGVGPLQIYACSFICFAFLFCCPTICAPLGVLLFVGCELAVWYVNWRGFCRAWSTCVWKWECAWSSVWWTTATVSPRKQNWSTMAFELFVTTRHAQSQFYYCCLMQVVQHLNVQKNKGHILVEPHWQSNFPWFMSCILVWLKAAPNHGRRWHFEPNLFSLVISIVRHTCMIALYCFDSLGVLGTLRFDHMLLVEVALLAHWIMETRFMETRYLKMFHWGIGTVVDDM